MHKPPLLFCRTVDWDATWKKFYAFFRHFPFERYNAHQEAAGRPWRVIKYRRANIRGAASEILRLVLKDLRRPRRTNAPLHFGFDTFRGSLATTLMRVPRSIDRYLDALEWVGFLENRRRLAHGIALAIAPSLIVFSAAGGVSAGQAAPAVYRPVPTTAPQHVPSEDEMAGRIGVAISPTEAQQAWEMLPEWLRAATHPPALAPQKSDDAAPPDTP